MKLSVSIFLFFLLVNFSFSQEPQKVVTDYEQLLKEIDSDTLITRRTVRYECSEDVFGEVHFFLQRRFPEINKAHL